ncbi:NAD(P)/FAD-dependent oxidoreductase [Mesorhizobium sp. BE184]|uniref:NAD(P)/FAD-dependent oxidoreductase n=1 Tax=Mesorhizobium sp. BE184 TaxID=2817714 RepID=UPI0038620B95
MFQNNAFRLLINGREVLVLEANSAIGRETSSRNSEVIHAGIYYPAGSLMSLLCVEGRHRLYRYLAERQIAFRQCGKLIVATNAAESSRLAAIAAHARQNGVDDIVELDAAAARDLEPALSCTAALLSPSTGIFDTHGFMLALQGDAENAGAAFAFHAPVLRGEAGEDAIVLHIGGEAGMSMRCRAVVNAAGLIACTLAASIKGMPPALVPRPYYAKGNYFSLAGRSPFSRLIYPVPVPGGLGTHLTLDLAGRARFGPDVEWIDEIDYAVDPARGESFYAAIRRYWPALPDGSLLPDYAGIRPKLAAPGAGWNDFVIQGRAAHGIVGLVNLFGIESPGLTASLAIAAHVAALV